MNKIIKQAFTLIELLVVIAIIGILSGLIVVSMSGMTTKATVAKAQVFSNSLRNSLMMNLVSDWTFDGSGVSDGSAVNSSYLQDTWSQKNGSVTVAPPTVLSGTNCVSGSCLSFNGSQYVSIPYDSAFNFGTQMTAMVWMKTNLTTEKVVIGQLDSYSGQRSWLIESYPISKIAVYLSDDGTNNSGHRKYYKTPIDNNWHLVGFTWNTGVVKVYIDGLETNLEKAYDDPITTIYPSNNINLLIGACFTNGSPSLYFTGQIDGARLYNVAISTSQIREQYYAGLNSLLTSGQINKEEYQNRLVGIK